MYYCNDCGREFPRAAQFKESHGLANPPYEKFSAVRFAAAEILKRYSPLIANAAAQRLKAGTNIARKNAAPNQRSCAKGSLSGATEFITPPYMRLCAEPTNTIKSTAQITATVSLWGI